MRPLLLILLLVMAGAAPARGQALADTVFAWKSYARTARCRVQLYPGPPGDARRHTVVLREVAENEGRSTVADAAHLAELVGRHFGLDPVAAYWVFYWGPFSYEGAVPDRKKELLLRATFRRTGSGTLGAPTWRVVTREDVEELTDRRFR